MKRVLCILLLAVCLLAFGVSGFAATVRESYRNEGHKISFSLPNYTVDDENAVQIFYKLPSYYMLVNVYAFGDSASENSKDECLSSVSNESTVGNGIIEINDGNIIAWNCSTYSDGSAGFNALVCQRTSNGGLFSSAKYRPVFSISFMSVDWNNTTPSFFTNERFYAAYDILESLRLEY